MVVMTDEGSGLATRKVTEALGKAEKAWDSFEEATFVYGTCHACLEAVVTHFQDLTDSQVLTMARSRLAQEPSDVSTQVLNEGQAVR